MNTLSEPQTANYRAMRRRAFCKTAAGSALGFSLASLVARAGGVAPDATTAGNSAIFEQFEKGRLACSGKAGAPLDVGALPWNRHKDFPGVFLKNIVAADMTGGLLTCHLVRIEPGCKIGIHAHPQQIELHEVIEGSGVCIVEGGEISYAPGSITVLARNATHEVRAGDQGLRLFAKFVTVPA